MKKLIVTALVATVAAMPVAAAFAGSARSVVHSNAPIKKHKKHAVKGAGPHKQVIPPGQQNSTAKPEGPNATVPGSGRAVVPAQ